MKTGRPKLRELVIAALPGTRSQIERKSGCSESTVGKWLRILRNDGKVRISGWKRSYRGAKQPIFAIGKGDDAKPMKTLTQKESDIRFRKRRPDRVKEIQHNSYRRCLLREKGHGFLSALFFTREERP